MSADLSVVLVVVAPLARLEPTLAALRAQTIAERIELVLAVPSAAAFGRLPGEEPFADVRVVEGGPIAQRGHAAAVGIHAATAPVVAMVEDHAFPEPGWAAALLAAHDGPWAGVGPAVENANAGSALSRVTFWLTYASISGPLEPGPRELLPWHNSSYKRELLTSYGERLGELLEWEGALQDDLRARGYQLYLEPAARTHHQNVSALRSAVSICFHHARLFGALRARSEGWPVWRRLFYVMAMPLFPVMRLRHVAPDLRRTGVTPLRLAGSGGALATILGSMAVGEAAGYLLGQGDAADRLGDFEIDRTAHLSARERGAQ
jgi:hypothetical protein